MEYMKFMNATLMVAKKGCDVSAYDKDGVIIWTVGLDGGMHETKKFSPYLSFTDLIKIEGDYTLINPLNGSVKASTLGEEAVKSGANPDFRPTKMTDAELRLRKLMTNITSRSDAVERRLAAMQSLVDSGDQGEPDEEPESEPDAEPENEPDAEPENDPAAEPEKKPKGKRDGQPKP